MTVASQGGHGAAYQVYVPASPEAASVERSGEKEDSPEEATMREGRILLVDDEQSIRDIFSEVLTNIGYEVTATIDGTEAVGLYKEAKASERPYDAVILDLTIPGGGGGKETIQKLMEIDPEVKAIVSSGSSDDPVMADFREYGFRGVITKPCGPEEVIAILNRVITEDI